MHRFLRFGGILSAFLFPVLLPAAPAEDVNIPFTKFVLDNGLTLIVHEDHKAPIVAVNVWYHVGSKNEKPGRTGFAHLFEHLMFNGSEDFDDDYFQVMERVGATNLNGTTNEDRTNYFENVPTSAFDLALWMESDRMGHLLGAVTQKKLDEQRGVVQNEKRQGENAPYAVADEMIVKATYPAGHPYSWTVIGSMEDLNSAALQDVHDWFKTYYGAANATIVVAGDIDPKTAFEKVKKYFGDVPPGPPIGHFDAWVAKRIGVQRQEVQDRVNQPRLYKVWNIPQWGTPDVAHLNLAASVLTTGKTSRLYKRLVYDEQIATSVNAFIDNREIGGQFYIMVDAKAGQDMKKVERTVDEELAKFLNSGPTEAELNRVKTQYRAGFIRGLERIGGFGGKSDVLAQSQVYGGSPDAYKATYQRTLAATAKDVMNTAREWLSDGVYILTVYPYPTMKAAPTDSLLRKTMPTTGTPPVASFPAVRNATLDNGLKIMLARVTTIPVVNFTLLVDAGYAADQFSAPGTASLAMNMLDEGTKKRTALQLSEDLANLGATLSTGSGIDMSTVALSALKSNLDASLELFADVILNPSFPRDDFDRLQKQTLAGIQREKTQPIQMGLRVLPRFLFGANHAYANPLTGSGTEESVSAMSVDDMIKFYQTWMKPNNSTLVVVGDITMDELKPRIDALFKTWKPGDIPKKNVARVDGPSQPLIYVMDKPGAQQSVVFAGELAEPRNSPDNIAFEAMNTALGGSFTSRINMNLREDKHWSYGSQTVVAGARAQRPYLVYAPVQTDKTKESMIEIKKELTAIITTKPVTEDELAKVQNSLSLQLPGQWETMNSIAGTLINIVNYGLPADYPETYAEKIRALTLETVEKAAQKSLHPDKLVWVVVGDRKKIEAGIKELGYGEVKYLDPSGNLIN